MTANIIITTPTATITHGPFLTDSNEIIAVKPYERNAPLLIVFHSRPNFPAYNGSEYMTHVFNPADNAFYHGHYFDTYDEALQDFLQR